MALSCSCEYDIEAGSWYWEGSSKLKPMIEKPRRSRCCSCGDLINTGSDSVEFYRFMALEEDSIAYRIHGESRPLASWFECEECTDLREALEEIGFCVNLGDEIKQLVEEYNEIRSSL